MNLSDIIPTMTTRKNFSVEEENPTTAIQRIVSSVHSMNGFDAPGVTNAVERLVELANTYSNSIVEESIKKTGVLPKNFEPMEYTLGHNYSKGYYLAESKNPTMEKFASTPKVHLMEVRSVVRDTKMVLAPYELLDSNAISHESYRMISAIKRFVSLTKKYDMNPMVIMPVKFLSVQQMVENYNPSYEIYAPSHNQYFDMLDMLMPVILMINHKLKEMGVRLDNIESKLDSMDSDMKTVVQSINNMKRQLERLQKEIKEQEIVRQQQAEKIELAERMRAMAWNWAMDPMLLAVDKKTSIEDNGFAFMGPCWGPDFDEIMESLVNHRLVSKNKNLKSKLLEIWG